MHNWVGSLGVLCILSAYFMLQTGRIQSQDVRYSVMNLLGSLMIVFSLLVDFNLPSFIVEAFWALISLIGIVRHWRMKSRVVVHEGSSSG